MFLTVISNLKLFYLQKMKTEDKNNMPKVRIAVIGKSNVGKSGKMIVSVICL